VATGVLGATGPGGGGGGGGGAGGRVSPAFATAGGLEGGGGVEGHGGEPGWADGGAQGKGWCGLGGESHSGELRRVRYGVAATLSAAACQGVVTWRYETGFGPFAAAAQPGDDAVVAGLAERLRVVKERGAGAGADRSSYVPIYPV
jgi:hypothetical protein